MTHQCRKSASKYRIRLNILDSPIYFPVYKRQLTTLAPFPDIRSHCHLFFLFMYFSGLYDIANNMAQDQTVALGAVLSVSIVFAYKISLKQDFIKSV